MVKSLVWLTWHAEEGAGLDVCPGHADVLPIHPHPARHDRAAIHADQHLHSTKPNTHMSDTFGPVSVVAVCRLRFRKDQKLVKPPNRLWSHANLGQLGPTCPFCLSMACTVESHHLRSCTPHTSTLSSHHLPSGPLASFHHRRHPSYIIYVYLRTSLASGGLPSHVAERLSRGEPRARAARQRGTAE
jgi:hypothetical protein